MAKDKYLDEFDKMVGKKRWAEGMKSYRKGREGRLSNPSLYSALQKLKENPDDPKVRAELRGFADLFIKQNDITHGSTAVEVYRALKNYKPSVKKKVVDFARRYTERRIKVPSSDVKKELSPIRDFLKETPEGGGLEKKAGAVVGVVGIIASLFFLSPVVTGNAIGNINTSNSSIMGIVFFVLGLAGLFISSRYR